MNEATSIAGSSWRAPFALAAAAACAGTLLGTAVVEPERWCSGLVLAVALFVGLPVIMTSAMLIVALPLALLVLLLGLVLSPHRPSGAPELARDIVAKVAGFAPGYVSALRQVRSPLLWGAIVGVVIGTAALVGHFTLRA